MQALWRAKAHSSAHLMSNRQSPSAGKHPWTGASQPWASFGLCLVETPNAACHDENLFDSREKIRPCVRFVFKVMRGTLT